MNVGGDRRRDPAEAEPVAGPGLLDQRGPHHRPDRGSSRRRCWSWPRSSCSRRACIARYVFNRPLVWSDELASAPVPVARHAGRRGRAAARRAHAPDRHRRRSPPGCAPGWTRSAPAVAAAALLSLLLPAWSYIQDEWVVITPALAIHDGVRVAAIFVGGVLMAAVARVAAVPPVGAAPQAIGARSWWWRSARRPPCCSPRCWSRWATPTSRMFFVGVVSAVRGDRHAHRLLPSAPPPSPI